MAFTTWATADLITAAKLNNDNTVAVGTDTARTVTVTHTWSASQSFNVGISGTTATATPAALTATQYSLFPSTVSGAALMGYGTTNDVTLMNRAGTVVLGIGPNTTAVNLVGLMTFVTSVSSVTGFATPSAFGATTGMLFASTVSGATLMGYGTTGDVTLKNRAGTTILTVDANATGITLAGALAISGALSGVTTLAGSGAVSGFTSAAFSGTLSTTAALAVAAGQKIYVDGVAATGDTYIYESAANIFRIYVGGSNLLTLSAGDCTLGGSITTSAPAGGTAAAWKLGTVSVTSPTSPNRTIELDVGGTIYYLSAKTTNN